MSKIKNAEIKYYGVRGSIPTPGEKFKEYGGNTTCLFIELEDDIIIIDAGTGIRVLGLDLLKREFGTKEGGTAHIFFSHTHWDHIQGFPFFIPAYLPQNTFHVYGETKEIKGLDAKDKEVLETWTIERTIRTQQTFMFFPASTQNMGSKLIFNELNFNSEKKINNFSVKTIRLRHPNNSMGFLFNFAGEKFCFCTDVEHNDEMITELSKFAKGCKVLAYDCQYTPEEYVDGKIGWGHSTFEAAAEICEKGGIENLHMIHHDPMHDDQFIKKLEKRAQQRFKNTLAVKEGFNFFI
ncbi:MAG: MBL fold metallo-hydrolase [Spirochaetia bacterium]|nr:MBL fold metallo-hydrolase [Spirochaetia bacterium]